MAKQSLHVQVYTAFYTSTHLYLKGRLLRNAPLVDQHDNGIFKALFYTLLRALSREVKQRQILCSIGTQTIELTTDKEGYFELIKPLDVLGGVDYTSFQLQTLHKEKVYRKTVVPVDYSQQVPVGIISDIDDTIMVTGVKSLFKLKVAFNTLFLNPFRRKPIEAAAKAFHQLSDQVEGKGPIVYISNSPWNLYDYLSSFLQHNGFPQGVLILRDMGWQLLRSKTLEERNKYREIKKILELFEHTQFILVGDSGELDFDIYQRVSNEHPNRIRQIIINKAGNPKKEQEILEHATNHPKVELIQGYAQLKDYT